MLMGRSLHPGLWFHPSRLRPAGGPCRPGQRYVEAMPAVCPAHERGGFRCIQLPRESALTAWPPARPSLIAGCLRQQRHAKLGSAQLQPEQRQRRCRRSATTRFTRDFSAMATLKPLASQGKGKVGVILPDTRLVGPVHRVRRAVPDEGAADGGPVALAVLGAERPGQRRHPAEPGPGRHHQGRQRADHGPARLRRRHLDREVRQGARRGGHRLRPADPRRQPQVLRQLQQRQGRHADRRTAWSAASRPGRSRSPNVLVMRGDPTDNNATLFAQGYDAVLAPYFSSGSWTKVGKAAGTWDPPTAQTEFQGQFTAHKNINARADRRTTRTRPRSSTTCRPRASRPRPSR